MASPAVNALQSGRIGFPPEGRRGSGVFHYQHTALAYSSHKAVQYLQSSAKYSMKTASHPVHGLLTAKVLGGPVVELHLQLLAQAGDRFNGGPCPGVSPGRQRHTTRKHVLEIPRHANVIFELGRIRDHNPTGSVHH